MARSLAGAERWPAQRLIAWSMGRAKVVYYGPGLSGMRASIGWLLAPAGEGRRFGFPCMGRVELGRPGGGRRGLDLYRLPMSIYRDPARVEVLRGVDGIVFVADSQAPRGEANVEALENLEQELAAHGRALVEVPTVLQYNKRDLPSALAVEVLDRMLNGAGRPRFETIATRGVGVLEALVALAGMLDGGGE